ncbi:endo-1,4-beta-xylanase [Rubripirellula amarantea]|nr:endo-1,4-beta-xylanase [Rubripirellula amarantea]
MGQLLFDVPDAARDFIAGSLWKDAYVCGIEGVPFQSQNRFDGSRLTIHREISNSGKLHLTCRIPNVGYRSLSTCSLRCLDEEAHLLPLELARGSCYRARVQSDIWKRSGLVLSEKFLDLLDRGTREFLIATSCRADLTKSGEASIRAIELLELANTELGESYSMQSIAFRKQRETQLGTLIAATVVPPSPVGSNTADKFVSAFNAAAVRMNWADIETDSGAFDFDQADQTISFCAANGQRIIGGPLIDFRTRLMPHWLYLFEDDFESFLKAAIHYVETTVAKFRGRVQLWNCATGLNTPGPIAMDDEQTMRLAVGILQAVRRTDPNTPVVMSFDQPFGEYLGKDRDGLSPLHFADALVRSGLGMAGIGLECRFFYQEHATQPRSTVDFGQMIDRWATLGMPMLVQLSAPGGKGPDPLAQAPTDVLEYAASNNDPAADQLRIAGPLIRTLLAKHIVHGIVWDGWCDQVPHVMTHGGLVDDMGQPRPLLEYLTRVRSEFLA